MCRSLGSSSITVSNILLLCLGTSDSISGYSAVFDKNKFWALPLLYPSFAMERIYYFSTCNFSLYLSFLISTPTIMVKCLLNISSFVLHRLGRLRSSWQVHCSLYLSEHMTLGLGMKAVSAIVPAAIGDIWKNWCFDTYLPNQLRETGKPSILSIRNKN